MKKFYFLLLTSILFLTVTKQVFSDEKNIFPKKKPILVPEINLGQFLRLIRSEYLVDAKGLNLVRGRPIGAATIVETVNKTLG